MADMSEQANNRRDAKFRLIAGCLLGGTGVIYAIQYPRRHDPWYLAIACVLAIAALLNFLNFYLRKKN
jgi:hypothetical protein